MSELPWRDRSVVQYLVGTKFRDELTIAVTGQCGDVSTQSTRELHGGHSDAAYRGPAGSCFSAAATRPATICG